MGVKIRREGTRHPSVDLAAVAPSVEVVSLSPGADAPGGAAPIARWEGTLAVEGTTTGDGREWEPGTLTWPDLPVPLTWQRESQPEHKQNVVVGQIQTIERRPDGVIWGTGVFDLGSEFGREAARLNALGYLSGVSVDLDEIKDSDVELFYENTDGAPEAEQVAADDGEDPFAAMFGPPPDKILYHAGRIRSACMVTIPAFVQAAINTTWHPDYPTEQVEQVAASGSVTLGAVGVHKTATTDSRWDAAVNEGRLPSPMSMSAARSEYAWIANGAGPNVHKSDCKFPHHEVSADGKPGAANLAACSAVIAVLNGGRGGASIPASDRQGVYDHVAAHLAAAGREPSPLAASDEVIALQQLEEIIAAGSPQDPPLTWFVDPELDGPTPLTILDSGRVYGHLATWGTCHTSVQHSCVRPPLEPDYGYFTTGAVRTREGQEVAVGHVTLGTGHAATSLGAIPAAAHYDDTGHAVIDCAAGSDSHGIWMAGYVRPDTSAADLRTMRASAVSGDWRRIDSRLRLVAVLAVNVPGFPIPRTASRVQEGRQVALVAAGVLPPRPTQVVAPSVIERIAASIGRDTHSRLAELSARVHTLGSPDQPRDDHGRFGEGGGGGSGGKTSTDKLTASGISEGRAADVAKGLESKGYSVDQQGTTIDIGTKSGENWRIEPVQYPATEHGPAETTWGIYGGVNGYDTPAAEADHNTPAGDLVSWADQVMGSDH